MLYFDTVFNGNSVYYRGVYFWVGCKTRAHVVVHGSGYAQSRRANELETKMSSSPYLSLLAISKWVKYHNAKVDNLTRYVKA